MKGWICAVLGITVMFWNVENFFDPFDDPQKNDDEFTASGAKHWNWKRFERKRDGIAKTIISTADEYGSLPSLVGLAEVENRLVLSQLVKKSPLESFDYGYVHRESPDERGIDVALLFRKEEFNLVKVDSLRVESFHTRDILYVTLRHRLGDTLHVVVVHLPSKLGGRKASSVRRDSALSILNRCVDSIIEGSHAAKIVVMGDFNDGPVSSDSGTIKFQGVWETIDKFVTHNLNAESSIYSPPFLLEDDRAYIGKKPRRTYIGPRYNGGLSDHLPIILKSGDSEGFRKSSGK
ncbi:MAG: endonuclease [Bacteroidales bacterium]|nr:endonuclease [Candidatus Cacconaster merdequi]